MKRTPPEDRLEKEEEQQESQWGSTPYYGPSTLNVKLRLRRGGVPDTWRVRVSARSLSV